MCRMSFGRNVLRSIVVVVRVQTIERFQVDWLIGPPCGAGTASRDQLGVPARRRAGEVVELVEREELALAARRSSPRTRYAGYDVPDAQANRRGKVLFRTRHLTPVQASSS